MLSERAAAEIEPVDRIASSSAILPGPMRSPVVRSIRMERRVVAMTFKSRDKSTGSHAQDRPTVKRHLSAQCGPFSVVPARAPAGLPASYSCGYFDEVKGGTRWLIALLLRDITRPMAPRMRFSSAAG